MRRAATAAIALTGVLSLLAATALARPFNDPRAERIPAIEADAAFASQPRDPACHTSTLASTGGALPASPSTLAIRWTGFANFEVSYKGQIMLLDAYFDRGSLFPPLGFKAADVTRANVILVGHGHHDHMSDAASVNALSGNCSDPVARELQSPRAHNAVLARAAPRGTTGSGSGVKSSPGLMNRSFSNLYCLS